MQGMPFDLLLKQPLAETFTAQGLAPNVMRAHDFAWDALKASLGDDLIGAWTMKTIDHGYNPSPTTPGVDFRAMFVRDPDWQPEAS